MFLICSLLGVLFLSAYSNISSLQRNIAAAKRSGLPYVVTRQSSTRIQNLALLTKPLPAINLYNPFWLLTHRKWLPLLRKLPDSWTSNWLEWAVFCRSNYLDLTDYILATWPRIGAGNCYMNHLRRRAMPFWQFLLALFWHSFQMQKRSIKLPPEEKLFRNLLHHIKYSKYLVETSSLRKVLSGDNTGKSHRLASQRKIMPRCSQNHAARQKGCWGNGWVLMAGGTSHLKRYPPTPCALHSM